jgi:hypothetical protein
MGILHQIDRRSEPRTPADFAITVCGVDNQGEQFLQEARVRDVSLSGALLSGIEADLRCGDVIGVLYLGKRARFRVIWVRFDDGGDKIQAAIHRIEPDQCPWRERLDAEAAGNEHKPPTETSRSS